MIKDLMQVLCKMSWHRVSSGNFSEIPQDLRNNRFFQEHVVLSEGLVVVGAKRLLETAVSEGMTLQKTRHNKVRAETPL